MRTVIVQNWCDLCESRGEHTPGTTTPGILIVGDGRTTKTLELCEPHRAELLDPLIELLAEYGVAPDKPAAAAPTVARSPGAAWTRRLPEEIPADEKVTCPVCLKWYLPSSLLYHLRQEHGARLDQPKRCPDCDERRDTEKGMTLHRVRAHGFDTVAALVASVEQPKRRKRAAAS